MAPARTPRADRFWKYVIKSDTCWLWTGCIKPNGYGLASGGGRVKLQAHRAAWMVSNGPIPDGLLVCHKCDVRACVRPDHLFLGTQSDNLRDAFAKGRMVSPFCNPAVQRPAMLKGAATRERRKGFTGALTRDGIDKVRQMLASGMSQDSIAAALGVQQSLVSKIKLGRVFRGSDDPIPP